MGAAWELDDRMTAYNAATWRPTASTAARCLLRLADDDAGTAPTLEACARAVDECAATRAADHGRAAPVPPRSDDRRRPSCSTTRTRCCAPSPSPPASARRRRRPGSRSPRGQEPGAHAVVHDAAGADPRRHARAPIPRRRTPRGCGRWRCPTCAGWSSGGRCCTRPTATSPTPSSAPRRSSAHRRRRTGSQERDEAHHRPGDRQVPDRPAHRRSTGTEAPLFPGVFAIFGHGNVTCLGHALEEARRRPADMARPERAGHGARRGRLRQGDAPAPDHGGDIVDRARCDEHGHRRRRRPLQPPAAAAAVGRHVPQPDPRPRAPAGRALPRPDDVGQRRVQGGHPLLGPHQPARAGACARCRTPWRRCSTRRPAGPPCSVSRRTCRPRRTTTPTSFFDVVVHEIAAPARRPRELARARGGLIRAAERPLIICGGGVHYSGAEPSCRRSPSASTIPVVETMAGKATLLAAHPLNAGPVGVTGCQSANALAADADVVIAVGTRLQDFTTGSWTAFDRVGPLRRNQRRRLRRHQALDPPGRRRRPRGAARADAAARRVVGPATTGSSRAARETARLPRLHRQDRRARPRTGVPTLRPGDRRRRPDGDADRLRRLRRRLASPAS